MTTPALVSAGSPATCTGGDTVTPSFGASTTAGDFLLAFVTSDDSASSFPLSVSGSGWHLVASTGVSYNWAGLWRKTNCGSGETAPTFSDSGSANIVAQLAEFSGVATLNGETDNVTDQYGTEASAATVTASAVDRVASDLIVALHAWNGANADPTLGTTISDSTGSAVTTSVLSTGEGASEPFWLFAYAVGASSVGSYADSASGTASEYENAPASIIASFMSAS